MNRLAIIALVAACAAPWMQVLRDGAGGKWAPSDPGTLAMILMAFEILGYALFMVGILAGAVALMQVFVHWGKLRGGALGLAALVLGLGGMMGDKLASMLRGSPAADVITGMAGGAGIYTPVVTLVIVVAAVVIEIVLALTGGRPAEPKPQAG